MTCGSPFSQETHVLGFSYCYQHRLFLGPQKAWFKAICFQFDPTLCPQYHSVPYKAAIHQMPDAESVLHLAPFLKITDFYAKLIYNFLDFITADCVVSSGHLLLETVPDTSDYCHRT